MDFQALALECAPLVAPQTLAAIVRTESAFKPFAININRNAQLERQPDSKEEAVVTATWLIDHGYNIDMGLGQINSKNLQPLGLSIDAVFDPCKNVQASATILTGNYKRALKSGHANQAALHAALSAYNTGNFTSGFENGYVSRVLSNATYQNSALQPIRIRENKKKKTSSPGTYTRSPESELASNELQSESVYGNSDRSALVYGSK